MLQYLRALDKSALAVFIFGLSFFALLYSKWLLSVSLFLLIPLALINILQSQHPHESFGQAAAKYFSVYFKYPPYWGLSLIFLMVFISGLFLGGSDYWLSRIRIKLPLLLAPLLFAFIAPLSKKYFRLWIYGILLLAAISLSHILINYAFNFAEIQDAISRGKAIPTPISHVRYSMFMVIAMSFGLWMFVEKSEFSPREQWVGLGFGLFIFIGLHILSVRSGLIAAYISLVLCLGYWVLKEKKWLVGSLAMLAIILAPWLAYQHIPSLKQKITYTLLDFKLSQEGKDEGYSDGDRIYSYKVGWQIIKENPIFGIGAGNFRDAVHQIYAQEQSKRMVKMPHNQFLSMLASTGIIGLLISLVGLLLPIFYRKNYRFLPLLAFYLIMLASMMVENTLETSVGLSLFLLPLLIMNNYLIGQRSD